MGILVPFPPGTAEVGRRPAHQRLPPVALDPCGYRTATRLPGHGLRRVCPSRAIAFAFLAVSPFLAGSRNQVAALFGVMVVLCWKSTGNIGLSRACWPSSKPNACSR